MVKMRSSEYSDYTAQLKMVYCIDLRMIEMHGYSMLTMSDIWKRYVVSGRYGELVEDMSCTELEGEICRQKWIDKKCMIESMWN